MKNSGSSIGLYGGSFNPVHLGHLLVAQTALEEIGLARLYFIPAAQSPFKGGDAPIPGALRLQMLRRALAGWVQCEVDDQELIRGGISYTIDTVQSYHHEFPGAPLYYLIGADHVPLLPKWRAAAQLAALVEFVIIPRPGEAPRTLPAPFRGRALEGFPLQLSSSQIRARVRTGRPVHHLVPPGVSEVIHNNRLYL